MAQAHRWPGAAALLIGFSALACARQPAPEPSRDAPARGDGARDLLSATPRYSQGNEELVIRDFFRDRRDGVFLDVGCASPIQNSNTYYLEKHLGWSGIGVDALPEFATAWKRKRPRSRFFNYLVTDHADSVAPFFRAEERAKGVSAMREPRAPTGAPLDYEKIEVPTTTLTRLLDDAGVARIDFLNLDIEGAELLALAGFDIDRFRPALACVEAKTFNREKLLKYFADHGYHRLERYDRHDRVNYYFAPGARGG